MGKRISIQIIRYLIRHSTVLLLAACCALAGMHALRSRSKVLLYDRVMQQDNDFSALQGDMVTLKEISMFVPCDWKDVSDIQPYTRHPALIAVYQACDFLGRQMTMIITRQENTSGWEPAESGALYFTTWYAGEGRTLYRIDVRAANARSAASAKLCRALRCMLSSMTLTNHASRF